ncbi:exodeoxyribonuclease V subunit alpha [Buchnera aphidicola str. APS (Acyrthosiphon pisum)]|uniref:RecBCD enzyme subunit RecD n=1 Tax=Buchnera aphidicola subsp. Acyrthosiphon pisum (strain APS) TaxID=107806 RepID=RECD_BUCAI|nr:exodeoxyribonuclease V subunit alpha [Buchnera aphidicola]P57530.1 RecName: Full=RecBCD enzyme subunit RecD; AltName: Full=Exonuclease V subunit RecD; Short=ExoV subunit RecD; AltName: Full=Helicase/nuclease RecBCD subunit RecD [Buchnera aphidicola str. APS (Acyrthosiphon pisum)]pir/A84983/ exodeoxyribonuclease V (EC 3.1.11.5) 67 kD polypeptide [imported] - Buchnera sp. (strain APS) [Buchnera sp. (in: enterobacteria)]BAB13153.1 exodeoxyribonuclease V 67 kD polypeptide [Buchnera aphidicola str
MLILLKKAVKLKIIRPIDFYFSQFIAQKNNIVMLVAACVSYESSRGYISLPIKYFEKHYFFSSSNEVFIKKILTLLEKKINWPVELLKHASIGNGGTSTPLVLHKKKIYLYKMWKSESNIFNYLYTKNKKNKINQKKCSKILENLFPQKNMSFQKIAVALTLINNITFIIGGPGTGKTTTILKIIIALIKSSKKSIKIQLSAPTGKATTHLNEILKNNIFDLYFSEKEKCSLPSTATTIHQLLGIQKISQKSFFNKSNCLDLDVLIIDEISMVDILMMEKILSSISKNTKLIFIGDHNQLGPIESGSILRKICYYANDGYSFKSMISIEKLTQYKLCKKINKKTTNFISDNICVLNKNYRFNKNSGIYTLSNAIFKKKTRIIESLFDNSIKNIFFYETNSSEQYKKMIKNICLNYEDFWEKIYKKATMKEIIESFQNYQVLCILHDGLFGVNIINKKLEENMYKKNIIKYFYIDGEEWYIGKPIMIINNNRALNVSNGNIGITNINKNGILQVSFLKENNTINNIPVKILRNYKTAWAITVHKSQGSEFMNTALILPNFNSHILNKDTLYTGITRSRKILSIFSDKKIFLNTIFKNTNKILF